MGGGGGGGVPSSTSITHLPRSTGEVRLASDVCTSIAALAEDAAARVVGIRHLAELAADHALEAVVTRQPLVHERVVGGVEVEQAAVID